MLATAFEEMQLKIFGNFSYKSQGISTTKYLSYKNNRNLARNIRAFLAMKVRIF